MTHLEDLLAAWWRESYPVATLNPTTAVLMTAFAAYVLEHHATTPSTESDGSS